jgi:hypothetical protein
MLTRDMILKHLEQLGAELSARGIKGEILLTGGASMCLVHGARDMTKDIDALYEPKEIINKVAVLIAERENLPENWLNDSVKGFVGRNAPTEDFIAFSGLSIQTVSAEYLLAMKLLSARYGERDYDDIRFLFNKLGIFTPEQAGNIILKYFASNRILPKTQYVIEEIIADMPLKDKLAAAKLESERLKSERDKPEQGKGKGGKEPQR